MMAFPSGDCLKPNPFLPAPLWPKQAQEDRPRPAFRAQGDPTQHHGTLLQTSSPTGKAWSCLPDPTQATVSTTNTLWESFPPGCIPPLTNRCFQWRQLLLLLLSPASTSTWDRHHRLWWESKERAVIPGQETHFPQPKFWKCLTPFITFLSLPTEKRGAPADRGDWPQHVRVSGRRGQRQSPQVTHEDHNPPQLCCGFVTATGIHPHFHLHLSQSHICSVVFCLLWPLFPSL